MSSFLPQVKSENVDTGSLMRCYAHGIASNLYCKTCRRLVCEECEECKRHWTENVKKIVKKAKEKIGSTSLATYKEHATAVIGEMEQERKNLKEELEQMTHRLQSLEEKTPFRDQGMIRDKTLIEVATEMLDSMSKAAFSRALSNALKKNRDNLKIEDAIAKEMNGYEKRIEKMKDDIEDLKKRIFTVAMESDWFKKVAAMDLNKEMDEETELALSLIIKNKLIDKSCINCNIESYNAFAGARREFNYNLLTKKELTKFGNDISISEPIRVDLKLRTEGDSFNATLSHTGILAIYSEKEGKILQLTNLLSRTQVMIPTDNETMAGFYDDKIILLCAAQPVKEALVKEVFLRPEMHVFTKIGKLNEVPCDADVSVLNSTRFLYYKSRRSNIYEYNVDTKVEKKLDVKNKVASFVSTLGINIGVRAVFKCHDDNQIYGLNYDGTTTVIASGEHDSDVYNVFLSEQEASNRKRAAFLFGNYLRVDDRRVEVHKPVWFMGNRSVVRLYRDVFLMFDRASRSWVVLRIVVS